MQDRSSILQRYEWKMGNVQEHFTRSATTFLLAATTRNDL